MGRVRENVIPNRLHDIACKFRVMFERIFLLRYPSHIRWDKNSTPDLEVYVTRKVTIFRPLGSGRLPSGLRDLRLSFNDKSLLYDIIK
jgi:hypothetical protein